MTQEDVRYLLGNPERSEGYEWGSAWFYRTAMTQGLAGGIYGITDDDFTPITFDSKKNLIGWGRNFYEQRTNKYEISIK